VRDVMMSEDVGISHKGLLAQLMASLKEEQDIAEGVLNVRNFGFELPD